MKKVLVVDDSITIRTICEWLHKEYPGSLVTADSLAKGRELLLSENPEVVLVDYSLPDGDSYAWCEELKSQGKKVVLITGANSDESKTACACEIIKKPFKSSAYYEMLDKVDPAAAHSQVQQADPPQTAAQEQKNELPSQRPEQPNPTAPQHTPAGPNFLGPGAVSVRTGESQLPRFNSIAQLPVAAPAQTGPMPSLGSVPVVGSQQNRASQSLPKPFEMPGRSSLGIANPPQNTESPARFSQTSLPKAPAPQQDSGVKNFEIPKSSTSFEKPEPTTAQPQIQNGPVQQANPPSSFRGDGGVSVKRFNFPIGGLTTGNAPSHFSRQMLQGINIKATDTATPKNPLPTLSQTPPPDVSAQQPSFSSTPSLTNINAVSKPAQPVVEIDPAQLRAEVQAAVREILPGVVRGVLKKLIVNEVTPQIQHWVDARVEALVKNMTKQN